MKADLNVYSALARLTNLVSQSDCSLVLLFMPVLASNLLILAHGRKNIDIVSSEFLFTRLLHCQDSLKADVSINFVLCTGVWKLNTAVLCCQNGDKLLQVNDDVFVAKGYEHIWASLWATI